MQVSRGKVLVIMSHPLPQSASCRSRNNSLIARYLITRNCVTACIFKCEYAEDFCIYAGKIIVQ